MSNGSIRVTVLGSGDAFGSGGRLQSSYLVQGKDTTVLLDCGATVLPALKRQGVDPGQVDIVLISHLHGDHFGGLPFLLLEYVYENPRHRPLVVAGPPGLGERTRAVFAGLFREAAATEPSFSLEFLELEPDQARRIGSLDVESFRVPHESKGVSLGFRITLEGRRILYSGDSAWSDQFIALSKETDLFLCECHHFDTEVPYHMNYQELSENVPRLGCKRLVLIHPGREFLAARESVPLECAEDGMVIIL